VQIVGYRLQGLLIAFRAGEPMVLGIDITNLTSRLT
jgi:hypothetical protein